MKIEEINIQLLPSVSLENRNDLPQTFGVYFVVSNAEILYVGASANVRSRWVGHNKIKELAEFTNVKIAWVELTNSTDVIELERRAIEFYSPRMNSDKGYIKPTLSSETVRRRTNLEAVIKSRNKTIYSVAKETGVDYSLVYKYCKKPVSRMSIEALGKFCQNLQCTPNDILNF